MPYNYDILLEVDTTLYKALLVERSILEFILKNNIRYTPIEKFGGHTECFSLPKNEELKNKLLKEIKLLMFEDLKIVNECDRKAH
jgi:hypothetical protein